MLAAAVSSEIFDVRCALPHADGHGICVRFTVYIDLTFLHAGAVC